MAPGNLAHGPRDAEVCEEEEDEGEDGQVLRAPGGSSSCRLAQRRRPRTLLQ